MPAVRSSSNPHLTRDRTAMKLRFASLALLFVSAALNAQPGAQRREIAPAPGATPIPADSLPPYVRQTAPTDPVIARIWEEGTQRSQVATLAQALIDSIGARLTASPEIESASRWAMSMYQKWGIPARQHRYGTWPSWQRGHTHVDLIAPRVRTLEAITLAWSPGTGGKAVTGDVVTLAGLRDGRRVRDVAAERSRKVRSREPTAAVLSVTRPVGRVRHTRVAGEDSRATGLGECGLARANQRRR